MGFLIFPPFSTLFCIELTFKKTHHIIYVLISLKTKIQKTCISLCLLLSSGDLQSTWIAPGWGRPDGMKPGPRSFAMRGQTLCWASRQFYSPSPLGCLSAADWHEATDDQLDRQLLGHWTCGRWIVLESRMGPWRVRAQQVIGQTISGHHVSSLASVSLSMKRS